MSDAELLQKYLQNRSRETLGLIVSRYIHFVHAAALRQTRMALLAEEVTQVTFILLAREAHHIRNSRHLVSWLFTTTRLAAANAMKMDKRLRNHERFAPRPQFMPSDVPSWDDLSEHLDQAISRLAEIDRTALLLHYFHHQSLNDVAAALGMPEQFAQQRIHRAVDYLRADFSRVGLTVTSGGIFTSLVNHAAYTAPAGLADAIIAEIDFGAVPAKLADLVKGTRATMTWAKVQAMIPAAALVLFAIGLVAVVMANTENAPVANTSGPGTSISVPVETIYAAPRTAKVMRDQDQVWLDGVERRHYDNSAIGATTAALRATGEDITYDQAMGFSGAAFRFQIHQPDWSALSTSSIDRIPDLLKTVGRTFSIIETKPGDRTSIAKRQDAIAQSIDRGQPPLFLYTEVGLILGYQADSDHLMYRPNDYDGERLALHNWDWARAAIISEKTQSPPRAESIVRSLKLAIELSKSGQSAPDKDGQTVICGLPAYQVWINQLAEHDRFDSGTGEKYRQTMIGNAWMAVVLSDARLVAARYLRSIRSEFPTAVAAHLSKAADLYGDEGQQLEKTRKLAPFPWTLPDPVWTPDMRHQHAKILTEALQKEREALAEIAAAIAQIEEPASRLTSGK